MTGEPRIYSAGEGSNDQTKVPVVAFRAYTVPCAEFVAKTTLPSAWVIDACTGPFGANDHRRAADVTSRATTRPFPPNAPPPTNTVSPWTAGDEIPASTSACQSSFPVARSMAYTFPSFAGAMSRGPAMAGDAATEPAVGKNQFSSPVVALRARTPYGGSNVTWLVVLYVPMMPT